jgi:hypothetical protein
MYQPHPSALLTERFVTRPWQGADPLGARFLFVGLDANYDPAIESTPVFRAVLEYHEDGVGFWRRHGVHHPFLLPGYSGDGKRFHRTFARIGFDAHDAADVSFIELLHVPTCGRSALVVSDLDRRHLGLLKAAIFDGRARHVFIPSGVARLMHATGRFPVLARRAAGEGTLPLLYRDDARTVYQHLHFSNYGKFQARLDAEIAAIGSLRKERSVDNATVGMM